MQQKLENESAVNSGIHPTFEREDEVVLKMIYLNLLYLFPK